MSEWRVITGDALRVLPTLADAGITAVITDPVWPNVPAGMFPDCAPNWLFREAMSALPKSVRRIGVHIGCNSDPRFLMGVPERFAFFRACWLEYVRPAYVGRTLIMNDVAYLFGEVPASRPGLRVIGGTYKLIDSDRADTGDHPCPRQLPHVEWLVEKWTDPDDVVCDPFCGTGTTGAACAKLGRAFVGIELEPRYADIARRRIADAVPLFSQPKAPTETQAEIFGGAQ